MVNKHLNDAQHKIAVIVTAGRDIREFPIPNDINVFYNRLKRVKLPKNTKKIIWYGLSKEAVDFLYKNKKLLKKSYWTIFGGDLYGAKRDKKNDYVRKNMRALNTGRDYDVYKRMYNVEKQTFSAPVPSPAWDFDFLSTLKRQKSDTLRIQINQSANILTVELMKKLKKFANEDVEIYTIISYGQDEAKTEILKCGQEIFGNKFKAIDKWMSPADYARHLADIDIFIHYDDRQSSVGNICTCLFLESKVYVRDDLDFWNDFIDMGVNVYNSNDIENITFEELKMIDNKVVKSNKDIVEKCFSLERYLSWIPVNFKIAEIFKITRFNKVKAKII